MQQKEGVGTPDQDAEGGGPPEQRAIPAHGMQERGRWGDTPPSRWGWGATPNQERTPFVHGLIQEMGGSPQDLQRPHTAKRSGAEGVGEKLWETTRVQEGAPPPLGGRCSNTRDGRSFLWKVYRSSVWALWINQYLVDFN